MPMVEQDPWTIDLKEKERLEEELVNKGGIHPYPWEAKVNEDVGWYVVDANGDIVILGPLKRSVAKVVAELYNRYPIVLLEDDIVY